jgi:hypothetical protein
MLEERFNSLGRFLKETFGERVNRMNVYIPGKAGSDDNAENLYLLCPGGTLESEPPDKDIAPVEEQIVNAKERIRQKYKFGKYIVHLHGYSCHKISLELLRETVDRIIQDDEVIGINLTVRLDTADVALLRYLHEVDEHIYLWVETGIHTIHDETLKRIGFPLNSEEIMEKLFKLLAKGLRVSPHIVFGLPGETDEMMHQTMSKVANLLINGVNIQNFIVTKGSPFETECREEKINMLSREEYIALVCDFIELLPPNIVLRRVIGEVKPDLLVAPEWVADKKESLSLLSGEMENRNSKQGCKNPEYIDETAEEEDSATSSDTGDGEADKVELTTQTVDSSAETASTQESNLQDLDE